MPSSAAVAKGFEGLRVAAFESRMAAEMARLIAYHGGRPLVAPSMREIPLEQNREALAFGEDLVAGRCDVIVLLTGVGTKALLEVLETRHPREAILEGLGRIERVCRGPKPVAALRALGLEPSLTVPEPNTWRDLLETLDRRLPVAGKRVAVQEYGAPNPELLEGLRARGATVSPVPVYRWALPDDVGPLRRALEEIAGGGVEVVLFTNANQVANALRVAAEGGLEDRLRAALGRAVVASVGPVASQALRERGVPVDLEPPHPKMGPLVREASLRCREILEAKRHPSAGPGPGVAWSRPVAASSPGAGRSPVSAPAPAGADRLAESPFMKACRREPAAVTPVWLMRQAGRYMKEYREIRARVPFLDLCKDSDLVAEVTVYAVDRLRVDAAIIFADLLLPVEAMGLGLSYGKGEGPVVDPPVTTAAEVERLRDPDVGETLGYVFEAIRKTRRALRPEVPLIGFAGAPFTVASYMIEGGGSRNYVATKSFLYGDPGAWHALLERISRVTAAYLRGQVVAGAQAVQIFDSWVGCLSPDDYREFVLPHTRRVIEALPPGVPVIHFGTGTAGLLPFFREAGGSVIGLDWRVDLVETWGRLGDVAVMGNLDPAVLFAPRSEVRERTRRLLARVAGRPGHIFNLGHGILPNTPLDNVLTLVDTVHEWGGV
jgi:uroporphyrinogen decarboxylase